MQHLCLGVCATKLRLAPVPRYPYFARLSARREEAMGYAAKNGERDIVLKSKRASCRTIAEIFKMCNV